MKTSGMADRRVLREFADACDRPSNEVHSDRQKANNQDCKVNISVNSNGQYQDINLQDFVHLLEAIERRRHKLHYRVEWNGYVRRLSTRKAHIKGIDDAQNALMPYNK